nr:cytochrome P450 71A2-like [Tanacetum cinerariifolium]
MVFYTFKRWENLPPSPSKLSVIENLHQLGLSPHRSLYALAKKHGPLMLLHFGRVPVVCARDIAFLDYGEYWRQIKSIVVLQLLSHKRVQSFDRMREEEIDLIIKKIKQISCSSFPVVDLSMLLMSLTNGVICRSALGRKHDGEKFKELFANFIELLGVFSVGDYILWLSWVSDNENPMVKIVAELFDAFLEGVIEEHVERNIQTSGSNDDENKDLSTFYWIFIMKRMPILFSIEIPSKLSSR